VYHHHKKLGMPENEISSSEAQVRELFHLEFIRVSQDVKRETGSGLRNAYFGRQFAE